MTGIHARSPLGRGGIPVHEGFPREIDPAGKGLQTMKNPRAPAIPSSTAPSHPMRATKRCLTDARPAAHRGCVRRTLFRLSFVLIGVVGCSSGDFAVAQPDDGSTETTPADDATIDTAGDGIAPADAIADAPDTGPTLAEACAVYAAAICKKLETCLKFVLTTAYGDRAGCNARVAKTCIATSDPPGTRVSHDHLVVCAAAVDAEPCSSLTHSITPDACISPPGDLALGAPCALSQQCASDSCDVSSDSLCGHCSAGTEGTPCLTTCHANFVCARDGQCHAPVTNVGDSCDPTSKPCDSSMSCAGGKCVLKATTAGTPCDATGTTLPDCYLGAGLLCPPATSSTPVCLTIGIASGSEPCGGTPSGFFTCKGPAFCNGSACVPLVGDGGPCNGSTLRCLPGAKCIAGTCKLPDPTLCK